MQHYLRYLFLLSGFGIFISGIYFWGVCPFVNAFFPSIEFWNPPRAVLLVAAAGDIVTGLAIFAFGLLSIREPFRRAYLKWIAPWLSWQCSSTSWAVYMLSALNWAYTYR